MADNTVTCATCGKTLRREELSVAPEFVDAVRFDFCSDAHQHEWVDARKKAEEDKDAHPPAAVL